MMYDLSGKIALVTGSSGRLGSAWAAALIGAQAEVYKYDLASGDDVTNERRAAEYLRTMRAAPDIVVHAAGLDAPPNAPVIDEFRLFDVNVRGADIICRMFGPNMSASSIVLIGSLYASVSPDPRIYLKGWTKPTLYGASKAAVVNLTKQWAVRLAPKGVRVNCLSPGGVRADQDEEFVRKYSERVPLGRMATVEDTIGPLLFLCSDASRYVTGIELVVDGGYTAW